jgi:hypothetical protein
MKLTTITNFSVVLTEYQHQYNTARPHQGIAPLWRRT